MSKLTAILLPALLFGCGQVNEYQDLEDGSQNADTRFDTGAAHDEIPAFEPVQGTWTVLESTLDEDGCGLEDAVNRGEPGNTAQIAMLEEASFNLQFDNGGESTSCTVEEGDEPNFDCQAVDDIDSTASDMGLSADIPFTMMTDGVFMSESSLTLTTEVEIRCDGTDCGVVELLLGNSFPCTMIMTSTMEAAQP